MSHALHIVPEIPIESAEPGPERKLTREERDERNALLRRRAATDDEAFDALVLENIALVNVWMTRLARLRSGLYTRDVLDEAKAEMVAELVAFLREWDPDEGPIAKLFYRRALHAFYRTIYRDRAVPLPEWMTCQTTFRYDEIKRSEQVIAIPRTDGGADADGSEEHVPMWAIAGPDSSPLLQVLASESLTLRLFAEYFDVDMLHYGMQRAGVNPTELGFLSGVGRGQISQLLKRRGGWSTPTKIRLLSALWPHVRCALEQRTRTAWHGEGNPFADVVRDLPRHEPRDTRSEVSPAVLKAREGLAERLRAARKKSGERQDRLARRYKVTTETWRNWESGHQIPSRTISIELSTWADGVLKG